MSRSSTRNRPRRARAQAFPVPALIAAVAVCLGVSLYAGLLLDAGPDRNRDVAGPTVDRATSAVVSNGVADPTDLDAGLAEAPRGYRANLTLSVGERRWSGGPTPPETADAASRTVNVRVADGRVRPGDLRAVVWT